MLRGGDRVSSQVDVVILLIVAVLPQTFRQALASDVNNRASFERLRVVGKKSYFVRSSEAWKRDVLDQVSVRECMMLRLQREFPDVIKRIEKYSIFMSPRFWNKSIQVRFLFEHLEVQGLDGSAWDIAAMSLVEICCRWIIILLLRSEYEGSGCFGVNSLLNCHYIRPTFAGYQMALIRYRSTV